MPLRGGLAIYTSFAVSGGPISFVIDVFLMRTAFSVVFAATGVGRFSARMGGRWRAVPR